jgi:hypothetical protein
MCGRHNRNFGTAKRGHGQQDRLTVPGVQVPGDKIDDDLTRRSSALA